MTVVVALLSDRRRALLAGALTCMALALPTASAQAACVQGTTNCKPPATASPFAEDHKPAPKPAAKPAPRHTPRTVAGKPVTTVTPAPAAKTSFIDDLSSFALTWLPIIFMGIICLLIGLTLRVMPRTKPQEIKPDTSQSIRWDDVAGAEEAKEELREVVEFLRDPKRFKKLGAKVPKGILLHGPPGTGKTLLAKAAANEAKAKFFAQSAASFVEMFAGLSAARIRRLFRVARKAAPAIIFIDELDAVGGKRGNDISGEREQTLNQLLVEMDGFDGRGDVVVMAASNLLDKLDSALLRPGRFDRQVFVSPPDVKGREKILEVHTSGKPVKDCDLGLVAAQTSGLTGADLANIANEAAIFAARRAAKTIEQQDFDSALERVIAGVQSRRVLNDHEKRVVAYHEAGHALCSELLPNVDTLHKISIVPRGRALGYTLNLPAEDRYLKTREELIDFMTMLLGGRVAEHLVFGSITTGASDDVKRVAEIAFAMIHEYAMGSDPTRAVDPRAISEHNRRQLDEEQRQLTFEAQRRAEELIAEHRSHLDALAGQLLEHEVLERKDIDRIMGDTAATPRLRIAAATALDET
ncbi:MAG: ATP-dependent metallopeptidase FtsH/Yme1/Tma family protein [Solirubrobacteraceae bacterium]